MSSRHAHAYIAVWGAICAIAVGLLVCNRHRIGLCSGSYWRSLLRPWKVMTFAVAAMGLMLIAPYTGDPTWDYVDAAFMSVLAFSSAPWAVGTFFRLFRGGLDGVEAFIAGVVWLFAVSWSYDLYLFLRDGYYPVTWWANLVASSVLYLAAGLFWNLDWGTARGWRFAFTQDQWPDVRSDAPFHRLLLPAVILMALVTVVTLLFAWSFR